jgi:LPS-assembly protein
VEYPVSKVINDQQNRRVMAKGHVEVYYNEYVLLCDQLLYDQAAKTLDAIGNVRMKEPDGAVVNADRMTLTDNFRDGFVRSLRQVTKDDARIASSSAYRKDGNTMVFKDTVYTPCKACAANPDAPPIWRIKAREVISDQKEQNIYFKDATLEIYGVPTVWVPYFYMPDPTVTRRSGFLSPNYMTSNTLGYGVEIPYYFALSSSYDLTLAPVFTTDAGYLMNEWQKQASSYRVLLRRL